MSNESVYVLVATDGPIVRECIIIRDGPDAREIFLKLKEIWGGENVFFASRRIDDIPDNLKFDAFINLNK